MAHQISDRYKCIFVHVPKAAGTSIERSLLFEDQRCKTGEPASGHTTAIEFREEYPKKFEEYFKFTVVRNPYSRLISAYFYLLGGGSGSSYDTKMSEQYFKGTDGFASFCRNKLSEKATDDVIHLKPQYEFICDDKMEIIVDFIGRQENFSEDSKKIFQRVGLTYKNEHLRRSKHKHFSEYYSQDIQEKVFCLYQTDFKILGYSSEIGSYNWPLYTADRYWYSIRRFSSKALKKIKVLSKK
jgi:hypothetical protein